MTTLSQLIYEEMTGLNYEVRKNTVTNILHPYTSEQRIDNKVAVNWAECVLKDDEYILEKPYVWEWNHYTFKWDDAPMETLDPLMEVILDTLEGPR